MYLNLSDLFHVSWNLPDLCHVFLILSDLCHVSLNLPGHVSLNLPVLCHVFMNLPDLCHVSLNLPDLCGEDGDKLSNPVLALRDQQAEHHVLLVLHVEDDELVRLGAAADPAHVGQALHPHNLPLPEDQPETSAR